MKVCVNVAIINKGQILLTRRNDIEGWYMPGGQVEEDETVAEAALREALGETGLEVQLVNLVGIYSMPKSQASCDLIVLFAAYPTGGNLDLTENKVGEIQYFDTNRIPQDMPRGQRQRIEDALNRNGRRVVWLENKPFDDAADRGELFGMQSG